MTEPRSGDELDRLAEAVLEGQAVDWEAAFRSATASGGRRIRALETLARIGALHQTLQAEDLPEPEAQVAEPSSAEPVLGRWGHLDLLEAVGAGASADVYRARDTQLDREVALKLLRARGASATRVLQEGRLLARVRHPNVATVYGAAELQGQVGLWMEFVRGKTLHRLVIEGGPMGAKEAALVGIELCRAVAAVHAQGVVHRDIKAQNAMRAEGGRILLVDFGIGLDLATEPAAAAVSGTPVYLAPEVFAGEKASFRSDLYSLGVLLFFLVSGRMPVEGKTLSEIREKHQRGERLLLRDLRPELPGELVNAVERALAPDPTARFPTAGAFEQALAEVLGGAMARLEEQPVRKLEAGWSRWKRKVGWAAVGLVGLGLGLGVIYRVDVDRWIILRKADRLHMEGKRELEIGALRDGVMLLPNDPLLLSRLSDALVGVGRYAEGLAASEEAFRYRNRVGQVDQERVTVSYYLDQLDYARARDAEMEVVRLDPSDDNALRDGAMLEMMLRNLPQAVALAKQAIEVNPSDVINYGTLAILEVQNGDAASALRAVTDGQERKGDLSYLRWGEGLALAMRGSYDEAEAAFHKLSEGEYPYNSFGTLMESQLLILRGDLTAASASLEAAMEKDIARNHHGIRLIRLTWLSDLAVLKGKPAEARRRLRQLEDLPNLPILLKSLRAAALYYAEIGDIENSRSLLERIRALHSRHSTNISGGVIAQIQGEMARTRGDRDGALELLWAAREQWGDPMTLFSLVRAQREAGLCREALEGIAELQKLKGFILKEHISTLWVRSFVEQARCHAALGNRIAARDSYQAFLDLWGEGAPDLPLVREARQELAALSLP